MNSAIFNIHNLIKIEFDTDEKSFYDFVYGNYRIFASESVRLQKKLKVHVFFHKDPKIPEVLANKIGNNIYLEDNRILFTSSYYKIYLYENMDSLEIVTVVHSTENTKNLTESFKNILKTVLYQLPRQQKLEQRYRKYVIIMRQSIHMPLFYLLKTMGFFLLHGAAVVKNDYCFLFLGLGGIGKTTLALDLVTKKGFKFLTDDYILIKDNLLYSFAERVRCTHYTLSNIGLLNKECIKTYSKYHIDLPVEMIKRKAKPTKIFFIFNSPKLLIERIDIKKAIRQISSIHSYLAEFPEHFYLTFLPTFPVCSEIQDRCYEFLKSKEIYNLYLSNDRAENMELLLRLEEN